VRRVGAGVKSWVNDELPGEVCPDDRLKGGNRRHGVRRPPDRPQTAGEWRTGRGKWSGSSAGKEGDFLTPGKEFPSHSQ